MILHASEMHEIQRKLRILGRRKRGFIDYTTNASKDYN